MAHVIADPKDIAFVLFEQLGVGELAQHERFKRFTGKFIDLMIREARNLAVKEIWPTFSQGDREGVRFHNGKVKVPRCYHRAYRFLKEGGWMAMTAAEELGGQGLPHCIARAAKEYIYGTNPALGLYADVPHAAGELIEAFGTQKQKELYLKKMYSGQWCGSMLLTEPQAGSDVGAISTVAARRADGSYLLSGNKIFITAGDHDLTENIIHPVLARVEGAPAGTKGISLFLVPKIWVDDNGGLGEPNDIVCTGVIEKMGIHGSATCSMALGTRGRCKGVLLGKENHGMRIMFRMMNRARLAVGHLAATCASNAYLHALAYARERYQGRALSDAKDPQAQQVPIIRHPDVRRMLMWMKSHVDGMRSLIYYVSWACDRVALSADAKEKDYYQGLIDLLTPVVKSYCSDRGFEICVEAMQVYGGYGYTRDYPIEQLVRDCKVNSIYEGTNGIQAMDLLGRKLGMHQGAVFMNLLAEMGRRVALAKEIDELADPAAQLETVIRQLGDTAMQIGMAAMSPSAEIAFVHAKPFLDALGDVCMAWMHIWRSWVAAMHLKQMKAGGAFEAMGKRSKRGKDAAFYHGVLKTAAYFIHSVLPVTAGRLQSIAALDPSAVEISPAAFGG